MAPVSEEIQKKHNLKNREGLAVTTVEEGSYAARGGIREGDILLEVNGTRLKTPGDLEKVASGRGRSTVLLVEGWKNLLRFHTGKKLTGVWIKNPPLTGAGFFISFRQLYSDNSSCIPLPAP